MESQYKQEMLKQLEHRDKVAMAAQAELEKKLVQSKQKQQKLQVALRYSSHLSIRIHCSPYIAKLPAGENF